MEKLRVQTKNAVQAKKKHYKQVHMKVQHFDAPLDYDASQQKNTFS